VKLLRVLQERKFRRVGGTQELEADVRFIAATNRNLEEMVRAGSFREDFFFRINVISVRLPALRERAEDIPILAEQFLRRFAERMGRPVQGIAAETMRLLLGYRWPGNVRELENVMERGVALEQTAELSPDSLPPHLMDQAGATPATAAALEAIPAAGFNLETHLQQIERMHLERALKQAGGVQVKAADLLGITFRQFRYLAKKYQLK
jgi:transcriptional regulator with PAS, ATPase and Fis domain